MPHGSPRPPNAGKGRKPGSKNKFSLSIKEAFLNAFERRGGVDALLDWAEGSPDEFYKLCGRLIPQEVKAEHSGQGGGPMQISVVTGIPTSPEDPKP